MSDRIEDVVRACQNVAEGNYPRRIGLIPVPEYSEFQTAKTGMWSTALDVLLTTLRYLAPATILTLFWGHHNSFFNLLKHIDRAIRTVIFSSNAQKETVLRWLSEASSVHVDDLGTLWNHGWILCEVLDSAFPGACAGHPPGELTLKHAQNLAEQYLGIDPIFTDTEFESSDVLTRNQEWRLAHYLNKISDAIKNLPPAVSKPNSHCNSPESAFYTFDYAARGLGLSAAQVNNKMHFKLYPTAQQSLDPADITIFIRGPKDAYGMAVIPPVLGKAQQIRKTIINSQKRPQFTENKLPTTLGATYLRSYGKNDMTKTYHIPRAKYDIEIEIESKPDHIKVDYVVNLEGKYEISITSKGQNIIGSPFLVTASHNILGTLERESFCLEDGEEVDILDVKNDRKVILRIVDFVTEKMLLREDGALERITDEEANVLMGEKDKHFKIVNNKNKECSKDFGKIVNKIRFKDIAIKVALLNRICKIFASNVFESKKSFKRNFRITKQQQLGIPDVVNSTLNDTHQTQTPANKIKLKTQTLSSQVEKQKQFYENIGKSVSQSKEKWFEIKDLEKDFSKVVSTKNPFIEEMEILRFNTQVLKESDPIKIIVEKDGSERSSPNTNPFIEPELLERPKTPILKIITGNIQDRDDSVYVDPVLAEDAINEFINPFFVHNHHYEATNPEHVTDFKIGAPVSKLLTIQPPSGEAKLDSLMFTSKEYTNNEINPLSSNEVDSMAFVSLDSNMSEELRDIKFSGNTRLNNVCYQSQTSKRDLWDSAYVSIDENNSSPDVPNKDNLILLDPSKKYSPTYSDRRIPSYEEFFKLGPAERELWDSSDEISQTDASFEENCVTRWDSKRLVFTPIIEENERSMSAGWNLPDHEINRHLKTTEPVTVAITEQNNESLANTRSSSQSSIIYEEQDKSIQSVEVDLSTKVGDVDSASDIIADVKRQTKGSTEGKISEVQFDSTESGSASHCLQNDNIILTNATINEEDKLSNIVWEKKKFWDEKIRQLKEIESSEQKNIKSPKRNGQKIPFTAKQITGNLTDINRHYEKDTLHNNDIAQSDSNPIHQTKCIAEQNVISMDTRCSSSDEKLVDKWKKYWDEKLEHEQMELEVSGTRSISPKLKESSPWRTFPSANIHNNNCNNDNDSKINNSFIEKEEQISTYPKVEPASQSSPTLKRDLPDEIMFQAFETSPKRFFGTSRKQILSKIDSFLEKQSNPIQRSKSYLWSSDKELVSRRVSVFETIPNDKMPYKTSKSKSLNNINQNFKSNEGTETMPSATHDKVTNSCNQHGAISESKKYGDNKSTSPDKVEISRPNKKEGLEYFLVKSIDRGLSENTKTIKNENVSVKTNSNSNINKLKKASICKSEMDIFGKITNNNLDDDFDKYKSYDDLPKINVKSFITLYEQVSLTTEKEVSHSELANSNQNPKASERNPKINEPRDTFRQDKNMGNYDNDEIFALEGCRRQSPITPLAPPRKKRNTINTSQESLESSAIIQQADISSNDLNHKGQNNRVDKYEHAFDIEVDIIENPALSTDKNTKPKVNPDDYRLRFKSAKKFFQSIEELSPKRNISSKLNDCEELLQKNNNESQLSKIVDINEVEINRKKEKSHSVPSSELTAVLNQFKQSEHNENEKLVKISEKFNVDDLFVDVVEGKLSRQGSLRGIPNKKAVLETFRSMENVSNNVSPYHLAVSQLTVHDQDNKMKNAQSYMKEYPYLPVTEPSKYHSRMDPKATGLLTMKELVQKKPRRNSVPEFILNPKFTVNM